MDSLVWWPTACVVTSAAAIDIRCRRIPNWLVVPFFAAGMALGVERNGVAGLGRSLVGMALAALAPGLLCWLGALGMGDLKLCVALGGWLGPRQTGITLLVTAMAGGVMAILWAAWHGALAKSFHGAGDLVLGFGGRGLRPHPALTLNSPHANKIPYAPAIAVGALFSFFC